MIYKILQFDEWRIAREAGTFHGSPVDAKDGFIHFSTASQLAETAARHFAGRTGLVLLWVDETRLAAPLKWEPSRGGDLFPHLYGALPVSAVTHVDDLPWDGSKHRLPASLA